MDVRFVTENSTVDSEGTFGLPIVYEKLFGSIWVCWVERGAALDDYLARQQLELLNFLHRRVKLAVEVGNLDLEVDEHSKEKRHFDQVAQVHRFSPDAQRVCLRQELLFGATAIEAAA